MDECDQTKPDCLFLAEREAMKQRIAELESEQAFLRACLGFYATLEKYKPEIIHSGGQEIVCWQYAPIFKDQGELARKALGEEGGA